MTDNDTKMMMERCASEIKQLRKINAELAPKADAYDTVRQVLNMMPQPSQGYGEDLVWKLENAIAEIEADQVKSTAEKAPVQKAS